jgi:RNA polymerase sigma factor (sigma-70 family)
VRNTSYQWLRRQRAEQADTEFEEAVHARSETADPETLLLRSASRQLVERVIRLLPILFREVLILRELEGLRYTEIAEVVGVPVGTVMSRLSRARDRFRQLLNQELARSSSRA